MVDSPALEQREAPQVQPPEAPARRAAAERQREELRELQGQPGCAPVKRPRQLAPALTSAIYTATPARKHAAALRWKPVSKTPHALDARSA